MSFKFPYLSLDIETTGLSRERSHVLQLAAIYDDGSPLEQLKTFDVVIKWPVITYGEEYAMHLNRHLLERAFNNEDVVSLEEAQTAFRDFLYVVQRQGKITIAGKNAGGFDIPILKNPTNNFDTSRFLYQALDPGSMFSEDFDHLPRLGELNALTGRPAVSHDALEDAWDVVHAIRYKWKV